MSIQESESNDILVTSRGKSFFGNDMIIKCKAKKECLMNLSQYFQDNISEKSESELYLECDCGIFEDISAVLDTFDPGDVDIGIVTYEIAEKCKKMEKNEQKSFALAYVDFCDKYVNEEDKDPLFNILYNVINCDDYGSLLSGFLSYSVINSYWNRRCDFICKI